MIKDRNQPDEGILRVRSPAKELPCLWNLGCGLMARGSILIPQAWKLSEKDQEAVLLGFMEAPLHGHD